MNPAPLRMACPCCPKWYKDCGQVWVVHTLEGVTAL